MFVADYVLMGYGTGAIMAVPGQDERDWEFAERFGLPIVRTVQPPEGWEGEAFTGDGPAINSANGDVSLDGLGVDDAKAADHRLAGGAGLRPAHHHLQAARLAVQPPALLGRAVPRRLRRARPAASRCPTRCCRSSCRRSTTTRRKTFAEDDTHSEPEPPLARKADWVEVTLDLGDGPKPYRRETNTMPQWAGSCWYELRYLDPTNTERFVDPEVERYWMGPQGDDHTGGVDLYVGGAEHAVLHLLYARFWHKVLFDLGHVSSSEPFHRLFNQGMIQAFAYTDERGGYVAGRGRGARRDRRRSAAVHLRRRAGHPRDTRRSARA